MEYNDDIKQHGLLYTNPLLSSLSNKTLKTKIKNESCDSPEIEKKELLNLVTLHRQKT